jgi:hypothetical protein
MNIKDYVLANPHLVQVKEQKGLKIIKYKKKVFYDDLWTPELEVCRGLVVDQDWNIVSRPFKKIYNYGIEARAPKLDPKTMVYPYHKVNGFMVAATWYNNEVLLSTTGSLESPFVDMAKRHLQGDMIEREPDKTFMFECVDRDDPHIIKHMEGLYYLAKIDKATGKVFHQTWSTVKDTLESVIARTKNDKTEGVVFYTEDGQSAKIKSVYYLTTKFLARKWPNGGLPPREWRDQYNWDEEYYGLVESITDDFWTKTEQERITYVENYFRRAY